MNIIKAILSACLSSAIIFSSTCFAAAPNVQVGNRWVPDPLYMENGTKITTVSQWEAQRRTELMAMFEEHIFGPQLPLPTSQSFSVLTNRDNGNSISKEIQVSLTGPGGSYSFTFWIHLPKSSEPVPVFLWIAHSGSVNSHNTTNGQFRPDAMISRGYGGAGFTIGSAASNNWPGFRNGVISLFAGTSAYEEYRGLMAWAWVASRCMDYFETDSDIDAAKVAICGMSRGGKASLLAGAYDVSSDGMRKQRFDYIISNGAGSGGTALFKDNWGEQIHKLNGDFPYWFADKFKDYNGYGADNFNTAFYPPVDMHQLIALCAPKNVAVGVNNNDFYGENSESQFLGLLGAKPVYDLYDTSFRTRLTYTDFWGLELDRLYNGKATAFYNKDAGHSMGINDWKLYMDFADKIWRTPPPAIPYGINCGSTEAISSDSKDYSFDYKEYNFYDSYFTNSGWVRRTENIANTNEQQLLRSYRFGKKFNCNIPLPNGNYKVTLHFMEPYFTSINSRVFDVKANGELILEDFDIYETAGNNSFSAVEEQFNLAVNNNKLILEFDASKDNALVCGIYIEAVQ